MKESKVNAMKTIEGATVIGLVQQTYDYSIFKVHPKNRNVDLKHVEEIKISMQKKLLFNPILINEKMEIIDGQHRFEACKQLGLPIWFIMVEGLDVQDMQILNLNNNNWRHEDFLDFYIKEDKNNYKVFKKLLYKYKINFSDLINIIDTLSENINGEKEMFNMFDRGDLDIDCYEDVVAFLEELSLFDNYEYNRRTSFVKAFFKLYIKDFYNTDHMKYRLDICKNKLSRNKCSTISEFCDFLANIYTSINKKVGIVYNESLDDYFKLSLGKKKKAQ
ncbi:ParB/RepB/Spo0J family partition protein [Clostridium botulinum]|uniref:ParB/RepB/Spo0J family partition protein n=1 Tax=Clostridium botulinum TaxID=1491 RepID=UPI0007731F83|nr:ParB/RepB/Spo0J family partition protein [Clostridium botulinum]APH20912.1 parB-like nuclease domain protein [Clostridium botulinum]APQ71118.1 parB-like nuclease domain protein [Clostridium botulinum]MBN3379082.1 hypothetical protein [Clostridium botulinum]